MIAGRYQSLNATDAAAYMRGKIKEEKARHPLTYGMGLHIPGNKRAMAYCGGHHYKSGLMQKDAEKIAKQRKKEGISTMKPTI